MHSQRAGEMLLAETAAWAGSTSERAQALLQTLRPIVPFDGAWLALTDPLGHGYHSLASVDLDGSTVEFLSGPVNARDIEVTGTDRARPPLSPSDLPYPVDELPTWADCLIPAGIHEALAVSLFAPPGPTRRFPRSAVRSPEPPSQIARRRLGRLAPVLAHGIDPMRSIVTAARLVRDATAGAVLHADGGCEPLPGLRGDALLISWISAPCGRQRANRRRADLLELPLAAAAIMFRAGTCAGHRPEGSRRRATGGDGLVLLSRRHGHPRIDPAGTRGTRPSGRWVLERGDGSRAGRGPADGCRPPGAHPGQARRTHQDPRRGPRRTGRSVRSRSDRPVRMRDRAAAPLLATGRLGITSSTTNTDR